MHDYDELMAQIAQLNSAAFADEDDGNYLYKKDVYVEENSQRQAETAVTEDVKTKTDENGYELPDFITDEDDVIKID